MFCKLKLSPKGVTFDLNNINKNIISSFHSDNIDTIKQFILNTNNERIISFFKKQGSRGSGILYYANIDLESLNSMSSFLSSLPDIFQTSTCSWQLSSGLSSDKGYIVPHVDRNRRTAINFYLQTNNETTFFYDEKNNNKIRIDFEGNSFYDPDDLTEIASFKAQNNEVWMLDVKKIHSVETCKNGNKRLSLSFCFNQPYEKLYHIFKQQNLIEE